MILKNIFFSFVVLGFDFLEILVHIQYDLMLDPKHACWDCSQGLASYRQYHHFQNNFQFLNKKTNISTHTVIVGHR